MARRPRILFGGFFHETHTFVEETTSWADFEVTHGVAVLGKRGDGSPTDGFLEEAAAQGFEVVPTLDARALPGGTVTDEAFERFWSEWLEAARPTLGQGIDGIFLVLHGAMATPKYPDAEGELLRRIRALAPAASLPLFGVLDLHANVSPAMCARSDGLVAYRENPHTDAKETAQRATSLLARALRERRVPRQVWVQPPLVWAPPGTGTADDPMRALEAFAREAEAADDAVWACNVAAGFAFADTPHTGPALWVLTTGPVAVAEQRLREGATLA